MGESRAKKTLESASGPVRKRAVTRTDSEADYPDAMLGMIPEAAIALRGGIVISANALSREMFGDAVAAGARVSILFNGEAKKGVCRGPRKAPVARCCCLARLRAADGSLIDAEIACGPAGGDAIMLVRDVTERVREERRIRDSENRYRTIFDTTGTAIVFLENDKTVSLANNELSKITGFSKEEVEGKKKWTEFIAARDLERMVVYHELRRKEPGAAPRDYEFLLKHSSGQYRHIYMTIALVPGTNQSVGSLIDLTEFKEKELALAASEERYKLLAENARDIIIVYDMNGNITYVNSAGCELSGLSREQLRGMKITDILPYSRNINLYRALAERTVGPDEVFINKTGFLNKNGEYIQLETSSTVIKIDNRPEGILVVARDITERKRLEREILEISEGIRQQVGRDLHDDLSPHLIGIEALSEVLKLRLEKKSRMEARELEKIRQLINEAITKTHRLVKGLCPIELGIEGLSAALANLARRISSIYGVTCRFAGNSEVAIRDNVTAINLYYIAQEASYNAVKHAGAGKIDISLTSDSRSLVLRVADNGKGIPLPLPRNAGNGLRIMKYRAEIMNGSLKIKRNENQGTSVSCFLPIENLKAEITAPETNEKKR